MSNSRPLPQFPSHGVGIDSGKNDMWYFIHFFDIADRDCDFKWVILKLHIGSGLGDIRMCRSHIIDVVFPLISSYKYVPNSYIYVDLYLYY